MLIRRLGEPDTRRAKTAMFGSVLLLHAALASAFCTEVALWVPWSGDTVDKLADVLHLKSYETIVELNANLDVDSVERGGTYTVPFTKVDPPATWATIDGCTPLLLLNADATSTLTGTSTSTSIRSTLETRARSTNTKSDAIGTRTREAPETSETSLPPSSRSAHSTTAVLSSNTLIGMETDVSTKSSSSESRSRATSHTRAASETSGTSVSPSSRNEIHSTTAAQSSPNTLTSTKASVSTTSASSETSSSMKNSQTATEKASSEAEPTAAQGTTTVTLSGVIRTSTEIVTKTATTTTTITQTITQGSSASSSSGSPVPSVVCHPDGSQGPGGSHTTDEDTLDKNAKKFCKEVKDVSLSESFESVQMVYGKSTDMYIFTVSWVRGCDGEEQGVDTNNVCHERMMGNWNNCNNKGQGGSTRSGCIEWGYRPGAIEDDDD